ncbi:MAG TPA: glycosyltransferase family 2 protein, partial [Ferruginibacter sp.]|nr:glycosyltransferase family 2 protein [Ferruginibacter sp.]
NGEALNSYKKKAIETAIRLSTGELIVTTDADCVVPPHWLQTIAAFYEQYQPAFIAAPVAFLPSPPGEGPGVRFIEIFQSLDFMTLQGITGASVYKKTHSMCNGANMAYTRKAFEEVGGFAGIDSIASGDDMLLMHKIYKHNPSKIMFLKSREAIVETAPVNSIRAFFNQRIRWASKATRYEDKRIFWVLLLVYLFNLSLLALPIAGLFSNPTFNLHLYPVSIRMTLLECWVILLAMKLLFELRFLLPVARFFGKTNMLWFFPLMQPLHILYTVIAGWFGQFGRYTWKQRSVK